MGSEMQAIADRALQLIETKTIRRVRTEAGVRRYKQPIGSIIINDSLLVGLTDRGADAYGNAIVEGANGKTYLVRKAKVRGGGEKYFLAEQNGKDIYSNRDELEVYVELARRVQEEAGIDASGPGRPGSSGKREGWSNNQVEAASDEIAAWGNSMEEYGHGLQDALYEVSARLDKHRDIRVARHDLEQLRDTVRAADADPDRAKIREYSGPAESVLNSAIAVAVDEGKLPKRYDADTEAAYAAEALKNAAANAGKPRPVKTQDIQRGQWIRSVDNDGNPQGDWFKVNDIGDQSRVPGRSRLIRGVTRDGKRVSLFQQGPRNKWETIADPKDQPTYVPPPPPETPFVSKRVHHISKGDRIHINGESGYMQDYMPDKDDYSSSERRKNPVYKLAISDDPQGKVNKRVITVPKGSVSAPPSSDSDDVDDLTAYADPHLGPPTFTKLESEYEGYDKLKLANGKIVYTEADDESTDVYDENDNMLGNFANGPELRIALNRMGTEAVTAKRVASDLGPVEPSSIRRGAKKGSAKKVESEYDGYDKYVGDNGRVLYTEFNKRSRTWTIYDKDDNIIQSAVHQADLGWKLDSLSEAKPAVNAVPTPSADVPQAGPALTRLKSKFDGWKRFKLPDGRVVDTGQATDDDNRWYATGKGGWDEIVADGDSEEEMLRKLRTVAGIEQPTSFSPGNTDVAPKREPSPVMTARAQAVRRSVLGTSGEYRPTGPRLDVMPEGLAARTVHSAADDYDPSSREYQSLRRIGRELDERHIDTAQAVRDIGRVEMLSEDMGTRQKLRRLADDLRNYDMRTPEEIRADAQKRRQAVRDQVRISRAPEAPGAVPDKAPSAQRADDEEERRATGFEGDQLTDLAEAREAAARINQQMRDSNSTSPLPRGSKLRDLDTALAPVLRNGKPLTNADRNLVPQYDLGTGDRINRLKPPSNRNLNNRLLRLAPNDQAAYEAVQDRATENYLNGMTHAAAWKEAIETAESIKVPDHYVMQRATRNGNGEHAVYRRNPDGTTEEIAVYRNAGVYDISGANKARGRMTQENQKARQAATRSVPLTGSPSPTPSSESAPAAPTAAVQGTGDVMADIEASYWKHDNGAGRYVRLSDIRRDLSAAGYSKPEQDDALRQMMDRPGVRLEPEPLVNRITPEMRATAIEIGGEPRHAIQMSPAPTADTPAPRKRDDPQYRADYERGWNASRRNADLERADARGESDAFYDGFTDHRIGEPKWTGADKREASAPSTTTATTSPEARAAEVQANIQRVFEDVAREQNINSDKPAIYLTDLRPKLDALGYSREEQDEGFKALNRMPGVRVFGEDNQKTLTAEDRAAAVNIGNQDKHVITMPISAGASRQPNAGQTAPARTESSEVSIATQAANIDEAGARRLAKEDPARFFEVVGYRYFKQGKDLRKRENGTYARAYDEMRQYAEQLRQAEGLPGGKVGTMQSVIYSMRLNHAGMMGVSRTMITIRKVFKEENGL
jgi:hypothetical protein